MKLVPNFLCQQFVVCLAKGGKHEEKKVTNLLCRKEVSNWCRMIGNYPMIKTRKLHQARIAKLLLQCFE